MQWNNTTLTVSTNGKGLYEFTNAIQEELETWNIENGLCTVFIQHTSASLCISENADPTAKLDLETFMERLAPENQNWHCHTLEGADDSPSHMRSILTSMSETIPIVHGRLALGTWQGLYVFEHRNASHCRKVILQVCGEKRKG